MDIHIVLIIFLALIFLVVLLLIFNGQSVSKDVARLSAVVTQISSELQRTSTEVASTSQIVSGKLGELTELARQIDTTGKDINNHFKAPQKRGKLGEILLTDLLQEILPKSRYDLQFQFQDGTRADAVINLTNGKVVIDSKFLGDYDASDFDSDPLASAQGQKKLGSRVRKHIDTVQKYIKPSEGTLPFALMFIPSEALYYEAMTSDWSGSDGKTLFNYACSQQVFPVGPGILYPYLMTIALGLQGLHVAQHAHEIIGSIGQLEQDYRNLEDKWEIARRQMLAADNNLTDVYNHMKNLEKQIARITSIQPVE